MKAAFLATSFIALSFLTSIKLKKYKVHNDGIILVTGASTGIGHHAVKYIAQKYNYKVLAGVRKEADFRMIQALNISNLQPIMLDVSSHDSRLHTFTKILTIIEATKLPFIGLVNNAGVGRTAPIEYHPMSDARMVFEVNFFGILELTQLLLPLLRNSKGRIVNISSISGFMSGPLFGIYASSKYALEGLSDALRRELDPFGISVSVIQPAYIKSAIHTSDAVASASLLQNADDVTEMKRLYGRFMTPAKDIAHEKEVKKADDPIVTSRAIGHALTSPYPETRYTVAKAVGVSAYWISWLNWLLTDRLKDYIIDALREQAL